jgi:hypothetical protein
MLIEAFIFVTRLDRLTHGWGQAPSLLLGFVLNDEGMNLLM